MNVLYTLIPTGNARAEGREPSHDGEFLSLYWYGNEWILEDNAGVVGTHVHDYITSVNDNRFVSDEEYDNAIAEAEEIQKEIEEAIANNRGKVATNGFSTGPLGGEARSIAQSLGWPINEYGSYEEE